MKNWYRNMNLWQRIFIWLLAAVGSFFFVGIPFLLVLIYLQLGTIKPKTEA